MLFPFWYQSWLLFGVSTIFGFTLTIQDRNQWNAIWTWKKALDSACWRTPTRFVLRSSSPIFFLRPTWHIATLRSAGRLSAGVETFHQLVVVTELHSVCLVPSTPWEDAGSRTLTPVVGHDVGTALIGIQGSIHAAPIANGEDVHLLNAVHHSGGPMLAFVSWVAIQASIHIIHNTCVCVRYYMYTYLSLSIFISPLILCSRSCASKYFRPIWEKPENEPQLIGSQVSHGRLGWHTSDTSVVAITARPQRGIDLMPCETIVARLLAAPGAGWHTAKLVFALDLRSRNPPEPEKNQPNLPENDSPVVVGFAPW